MLQQNTGFVSLSQAVAVDAVKQHDGSFTVKTFYKSERTYSVVMDGLRFAKFARLARKSGIPVTTVIPESGQPAPIQPEESRVVIIDSRQSQAHTVKVLFHSRHFAHKVDWTNIQPQTINALILDKEIVIEHSRRDALAKVVADYVVKHNPKLTVYGNMVSFTIER